MTRETPSAAERLQAYLRAEGEMLKALVPISPAPNMDPENASSDELRPYVLVAELQDWVLSRFKILEGTPEETVAKALACVADDFRRHYREAVRREN